MFFSEQRDGRGGGAGRRMRSAVTDDVEQCAVYTILCATCIAKNNKLVYISSLSPPAADTRHLKITAALNHNRSETCLDPTAG